MISEFNTGAVATKLDAIPICGRLSGGMHLLNALANIAMMVKRQSQRHVACTPNRLYTPPQTAPLLPLCSAFPTRTHMIGSKQMAYVTADIKMIRKQETEHQDLEM
jgi:hypothetical protein